MFAIPWNFPFRKKDGSISNIGDEMGSGGGSTYELPTASDSTKGGVKVGAGLTMEGEVLKNTNPTPYTLPTASDSVLGGIKVGSGLSILEGVLSVTGGSGGSCCHMFYCETNQIAMTKIYVLTSENSLTDMASLIQCVKNGFGFIIDGSSGDNSKIPIYLEYIKNGNVDAIRGRCIGYALSDSTLSPVRSTTSIISSGTVSNIKQIF